jgi:hypothetical protein
MNLVTRNGTNAVNTVLAWVGTSPIDGVTIGLFVTGLKKTNTPNTKTDDMVQTYILRLDMHPQEALKMGMDASICGNCTHRPQMRTRVIRKKNGTIVTQTKKVRTCYVRVSNAPGSIYGAFMRGNIPTVTLDDVNALVLRADKPVRMGAYGDPAMIPADIWDAILYKVTAWTGYTHQWRETWSHGLIGRVMASCDNKQDQVDAVLMGWEGTFTVLPHTDFQIHFKSLKGTRSCPSDPRFKSIMDLVPCASCKACMGTQHRAIQAHGSTAKWVVLPTL